MDLKISYTFASETIETVKKTRLISFLVVLLTFNISIFGQNNYKAANEGWLVSMDEAYKISKKTGKPILANFTGSDWCGWCKRLTADVFVTQEFKTWAEKNVVLLELDFPRRFALPADIQQQNYSLQQSFQVGGYPTIWVFNVDKNPNGEYAIEALGKTGYTKSPTDFIAGVNQMLDKNKANAPKSGDKGKKSK